MYALYSRRYDSEDLTQAVAELGDVARYFEDAESALNLIRPLAEWVKEELHAAKSSGQGSRGSFGSFSQQQGQPVRAAPGDRIWKGEEAVAAVYAALAPSQDVIRWMRSAGMGATNQECVKRHVHTLVNEAAAVSSFDGGLMRKINQSVGKFGAKGLGLANQVCMALKSMLDNARDYIMCACANLDHPGGGGGRGAFKPEPGLALWCLRPAVSFRPVAKEALCVIITSGTLSPTDSLEGELGVDFPVKVEAPHIVPRRQIHVAGRWCKSTAPDPRAKRVRTSSRHRNP